MLLAAMATGDCGVVNCLTSWCQAASATKLIVGKIETISSTFLYPHLFLAKFDACQIRQRLPALGQVLQGAPTRAGAAEFPTLSIAPTALSLRLRFGKSDRSTCHWQVAQTVLWHPVFAGGAGRSGGLAQSPGYLPSAAEATPQRLRSVMAELAQSPQESLNRFCADLCNEISGG